jgi:hypothetical protein
MTDFNVCLVESGDCPKTAICWNHFSHHLDCCHIGYRTVPVGDSCVIFEPFPEQDGWQTVYASQGALS